MKIAAMYDEAWGVAGVLGGIEVAAFVEEAGSAEGGILVVAEVADVVTLAAVAETVAALLSAVTEGGMAMLAATEVAVTGVDEGQKVRTTVQA